MVDRWRVDRVVSHGDGVRAVLKSETVSDAIMSAWGQPLAASIGATASIYRGDGKRNKIRIQKSGENFVELMIDEANSGDLFGVVRSVNTASNIRPRGAKTAFNARVAAYRRRRRG